MLPSFSIPLVQFHSAFDIPGGPLIRRGDRWEDDVQLGVVSWGFIPCAQGECVQGKNSERRLPDLSVLTKISHLF